MEVVTALQLTCRQVKCHCFNHFGGLFITKHFMLSRLALETLLEILQGLFAKRLQTLRFGTKRLKQDQDL